MARVFAVQGLYTFDVHDRSLDLSTVIFDTIEVFNVYVQEVKNMNMQLLKILIEGTIDNLESIDERLESHLSAEWQLSRLPLLVKEIMRVGVFELISGPQPSHAMTNAMIINEYLELAKVFACEEDTPFINGVLDAIQKEVK
ncbi:transcription antitermination factor NusB [Rickettsiales endosymbiont of Peranema trichophorum]|uniref:transcription antitermination factor NusB n=1 Tax=Rickettsiales endosymbiont of Peranema trichophorum TaxID=2486577 RepID=UPI0010233262|nr:transcription antitermination factor NusB [Rickettsiales endosymbiont of Peranema trichophorum]RZI47774.1 transcription antitermination factor NusB [Rickettsiales endosymbiont of Peranema trichophorum]